MLKLTRLEVVWVGLAAFWLSGCGSDKPAIPPVAPVVQPMPEEDFLGGDDAAGETDEPAETPTSSSKAREDEADTAEADADSAAATSEPAEPDAGSTKAGSAKTKYKSKKKP